MANKPSKVICTNSGCGKMASYVGKGTVDRLTTDGTVKTKINLHKCDVCGSRTWRFA